MWAQRDSGSVEISKLITYKNFTEHFIGIYQNNPQSIDSLNMVWTETCHAKYLSTKHAPQQHSLLRSCGNQNFLF